MRRTGLESYAGCSNRHAEVECRWMDGSQLRAQHLLIVNEQRCLPRLAEPEFVSSGPGRPKESFEPGRHARRIEGQSQPPEVRFNHRAGGRTFKLWIAEVGHAQPLLSACFRRAQ